jgi:hypothetical protein
MQPRVRSTAAAAVAAGLITTGAVAGDVADIVGFTDLEARLGALTPTGAEIEVSQVEAPSGGAYGPNQSSSQFDGKVFVEMSGPAGSSGHATNVAGLMYGLSSVAPGVPAIYLYEAGDWIYNGFLRTGTGFQPRITPGDVRVFNHSWVALLASTGNNINALRRADLVVERDGTLIVAGMHNSSMNWPLLGHAFNNLSVGTRDSGHASGDTLSPYDGPGRQKPEVVAPAGTTSSATPIVSAVAILLVDTAKSWPSLAGNPNAGRPEVVKAALLAGATHEDLYDSTWSNGAVGEGADRGTTTTPFDPRVGAGTVNVDRAHRMLTGGEHDGAADHASAPAVPRAGWDLASTLPGDHVYWRIDLAKDVDELTILATWNRSVSVTFTWTLADTSLTLWRLGDGGTLETLVGDAGLGVFAGGNVASDSGLDNNEHLHVTGLAAGSYVLELHRQDLLPELRDVAVAWLWPSPADIDGDGVVGFSDLLLLLAAWGPCPDCPEDIDGNGVVDFQDLLLLLASWG